MNYLRLCPILLVGVHAACSGVRSPEDTTVDGSGSRQESGVDDPSEDAGRRDLDVVADARVVDVGHADADATVDAAIPSTWGELPELCPNPVEYDAVEPNAFELISVAGGWVVGRGRPRSGSPDVLGVLDPMTTYDVAVGSVYRYDSTGRSHVVYNSGRAYGYEFWQRPSERGIMFAFEGGPRYDAPGCGEEDDRGAAMVAFEVDDSVEPWAFRALGCKAYGVSWDRDLVTDTDGDGLPEVLAVRFPSLDELNPDGTFTELWQGVWRGEYPARYFENVSLASADLDGDGYAEFSVSATFAEGPPELISRGAFRIMEYDPAVGYVVRFQAIAPFYVPYWQASGDVDGDGQPEFLYGGPADNCRWLGFYHAIANDTYVLKWSGAFNDPEGYEINEARMGDTDGDGDDEVVLPSGCHVRVLEWNGERLVQVGDIPVGEHCAEPDAFAADLDGDGADEIVVTNQWGSLEHAVDPTGVAVWKRRRTTP